jgi:hypothetical protein
MQNIHSNICSQEQVLDLPWATGGSGPRMDEYLLRSTQRLDVITERASRGEIVDQDSRDWMLAQVDFLAESLGNESLKLDDEMRSNLLQFLLAIANLNEQIRHQASLSA